MRYFGDALLAGHDDFSGSRLVDAIVRTLLGRNDDVVRWWESS